MKLKFRVLSVCLVLSFMVTACGSAADDLDTQSLSVEEDTDVVVRWRNEKIVVENFIYRKPISKEEHLNWLKNKSIKTVDEVLQGDLAAIGKQTVKDGKAISYKELLKIAKANNMTDTLKKIKYLNIAQVAGYLYSGIVLGYLIPKLNIMMTNSRNKKQELNLQNNKSEPIKTPQIAENKFDFNFSNKPIFANFINQ